MPVKFSTAKTLIAAATLAALATVPAHAETLVGLTTTNALFTFDSGSPAFSSALVNITGLQLNEVILGIDLRPATSTIYGLGSAGRLYTLNSSTGVATFASTLAGAGFAGLSGTTFGVDFNPVPDRLRVTTNAGQNLRINITTGGVTTDGPINGAVSALSASAYTNSRPGATSTKLYGINSATDSLYTQAPPNNGTTTLVGALGVDTSGVAGFDISGGSGIAYAALTDGDTGKSAFYTINLGTGAASLVGAFGIGGNTAIAPPVLGLTVSAVPEPETYALMLAGLGVVGFMAKRRKAA